MDAVLNWIWQGSVIALATGIALAIVERSHARDRYLLVWTALICVLALPLIPYLWWAPFSSTVATVPSTTATPLLTMPNVWWTSDTTLLALWTLWCAIAAGRLGSAVVSLRRVKRSATRLPGARHTRLVYWSSVMTRGRRADLLVSNDVRSAAVLGCGAPAIVVTPALLDRLTDDELDRIVIHEWAHVQRRDDVMHLLQASITVIAGWHPAVWWLSRQLRIEREIACDEIAVTVTGSAKRYAASLVKLAELPADHVRALPVPAAIDGAGLRRRIVRILANDQHTVSTTWRMAALAAGAAVCVLAWAVGGMQVIEAAVAMADANIQVLDAPFERLPAAEQRSVERGLPPAPQPAPEVSVQRAVRREPAPQSSAVSRAPDAPTAVPQLADLVGAQISGAFSAAVPAALTHGESASASPSLPPWRAASDGGKVIGRESRDAAVATASYFTRLGKRIGGSF